MEDFYNFITSIVVPVRPDKMNESVAGFLARVNAIWPIDRIDINSMWVSKVRFAKIGFWFDIEIYNEKIFSDTFNYVKKLCINTTDDLHYLDGGRCKTLQIDNIACDRELFRPYADQIEWVKGDYEEKYKCKIRPFLRGDWLIPRCSDAIVVYDYKSIKQLFEPQKKVVINHMRASNFFRRIVNFIWLATVYYLVEKKNVQKVKLNGDGHVGVVPNVEKIKYLSVGKIHEVGCNTRQLVVPLRQCDYEVVDTICRRNDVRDAYLVKRAVT